MIEDKDLKRLHLPPEPISYPERVCRALRHLLRVLTTSCDIRAYNAEHLLTCPQTVPAFTCLPSWAEDKGPTR